jgi:metal-responsive CopG/Arc/MetJ family transcriptional regulator
MSYIFPHINPPMSTVFEKTISVRLPEAVWEAVEEEAVKAGSKKSEIIRRALKAHYDGLREGTNREVAAS